MLFSANNSLDAYEQIANYYISLFLYLDKKMIQFHRSDLHPYMSEIQTKFLI